VRFIIRSSAYQSSAACLYSAKRLGATLYLFTEAARWITSPHHANRLINAARNNKRHVGGHARFKREMPYFHRTGSGMSR
jgi:hypothetical protein